MADSFWEERYEQNTEERPEERKGFDILERILPYWYIPIAVVLFILLSKTLALIAALALMTCIAVLASCYRFIFRRNLGIELISLFSITTSVAVHPVAGALVAVASVAVIDRLHKRPHRFRNSRLLVYGGLCFLTGFFSPAGIIWTGLMLVLLRNAIFIIVTFFHAAEELAPNIPRVIINIAVNLWLFASIGGWMISTLA